MTSMARCTRPQPIKISDNARSPLKERYRHEQRSARLARTESGRRRGNETCEQKSDDDNAFS